MHAGACRFCEPLENRLLRSVGATVPYVTYEAESASYTGALLGPSYVQNTVQAESSGRAAVRLANSGNFIQFTSTADANSVVVRYSLPDSAGGTGNDATLGLYINGVLSKRLAVTSKYSWLYGAYPFNNTPTSGSPRNFYDEVRVMGVSIPAGSIVRIQRDTVDTAAYYDIDLVDLENTPAPLAQPVGNWISVNSFNAVGDGIADDTTAIRNTVNAAISQGKNVWVPPGTYKLSGYIQGLQNVTIQGAGMWDTTFVGDAALYNTSASRRVGFMGSGNNVHLNDFAIIGRLNYRNDSEPNDGIGGSFGTGSSISNLWIEHTKVGMWLVNSNGLTVTDSRMRNTIADGINFSVGMRSSTATNCTARGTGDDAFAIWPATYISQSNTPGLNTFSHCTGEVPFLANGGAIYGGQSNAIDSCLFRDIGYGAGVLISGTFPVGTNTFTGTTTISNSNLVRTGGGQYLAAMQFAMANHPIAGVVLSGLNIVDSAYSGVGISDIQSLTATASNLNIANVGLAGSISYGVFARDNTIGSLSLSNSIVPDYNDASPNFKLNFSNVTGQLPSPWLAGDIGNVGKKGGASYSAGIYTVNGAGADIAGAADAFQFAAQSVTGDQSITATVQSIQNTNAAAKAGLMFRNDASTASAYAAIFVTPSNGVRFQWRTTAGGATSTSTVAGVTAPVQLRLRRVGNNFSAFYSTDGTTWVQVGAATSVTLNSTTLVGLATTARTTSVVAASQFSNVIVAPIRPGLIPIRDAPVLNAFYPNPVGGIFPFKTRADTSTVQEQLVQCCI